MYKIAFFVPAAAKEIVKEEMFKVGAGRIGNYACCSWETLGQGQFMPLDGAQPYIGESGKIEQVPEYRVEMVCSKDKIEEAIAAMRRSHPYETPAYDLIQLEDL